MRDKSIWGRNAVLFDILRRLGFELAKQELWSKYCFTVETVGAGCELAEKIANLSVVSDEIKPILAELEAFYVNK